MQTIRFFILGIFLIAVASCGNQEKAATSNSNISVDTTKKAERVAIADTSHHLFFRPKVGSIQRYHIIDRISMSSSDTPPGSAATKRSAISSTEIYLHQNVKAIRRDSSVELVFHVDSINMTSEQDTTKSHYSSSNLKDRMNNDAFQEFNLLIGKDFSLLTNKYGDIDSITDVSSITAAMLATLPDSERSNPNVLRYAHEQAEQIANAYIMRTLVHSPTRALIQDTTWHSSSDVNLDIAPGLAFPVHIDASEMVRGLEKRDDIVLAILEDSTTTTPTKRVFDEGPTRATISDFRATSHSIVRIEDATGALFHRAMVEKRNFTLVVESKDHPGEKRTVTQNGSEELVTELME